MTASPIVRRSVDDHHRESFFARWIPLLTKRPTKEAASNVGNPLLTKRPTKEAASNVGNPLLTKRLAGKGAYASVGVMRWILGDLFLTSVLVWGGQTVAANDPAAIDETFLTGSGAAGGSIRSLAYIPSDGEIDERIFIGGTFTSYDEEERELIALLRSNGTMVEPEDFDPGAPSGGFSPRVESVAYDPSNSGRYFVAGFFSQIGEISRQSIARLNLDGSVDSGFDPGAGPNNTILDMVVRENGSIVVVGLFTSFDGTPVGRIASVGLSGQTGSFGGDGFNNVARTIVMDGEGRFLVGGDFTEFRGEAAGRLARLTSSGGDDEGFSLGGEGFNGQVNAISVDEEGFIYVGGNFTELNGEPANRFVKLNSSGSRVDEADFDIGTGFNDRVDAIAVQADGRILVGGDFDEVSRREVEEGEDEPPPEEYTYIGLVRLESDGTIDETFDPGQGVEGTVRSITLQEDGRILLAGSISRYDGQQQGRIVRLLGGDVDDEPPPPDPTSYDLWVANEFPNEDDPGIIGPEADPDKDGVVNLLEYAFGGDPQVAGSAELPGVEPVEDGDSRHLRISFIRIEADDLVYSVEASNDLEVWEEEIWTSADNPFDGTDGVAVEEVVDVDHAIGDVAGRSRFLRVRVLLVE